MIKTLIILNGIYNVSQNGFFQKDTEERSGYSAGLFKDGVE